MGIVNVTPDSFSDGGDYFEAGRALDHGRALAEAGADVLDIGGESTRPGAEPVPLREELRRVVAVVDALVHAGAGPVSIDTRNAAVAVAALDAGARIVNDVSGGHHDPEMLGAVADSGAGFVVMHMRGTPATMQDDPRYDDVVDDVSASLVASLDAARRAGIAESALFADPGIGFAKTPEHNIELLGSLPTLAERVGVPLVVGTSRKRFLAPYSTAAPNATHSAQAVDNRHERDDATLATSVWAFARGARVVRVHDVIGSAAVARLMRSEEEEA